MESGRRTNTTAVKRCLSSQVVQQQAFAFTSVMHPHHTEVRVVICPKIAQFRAQVLVGKHWELLSQLAGMSARKRHTEDDRFLGSHFSSGGNLGLGRGDAIRGARGPDALKQTVLSILQEGETVTRCAIILSLHQGCGVRFSSTSKHASAGHSSASGRHPGRPAVIRSGGSSAAS